MKRLGKFSVILLAVIALCALFAVATCALDANAKYHGGDDGSTPRSGTVQKTGEDGNLYYEYSRDYSTIVDFPFNASDFRLHRYFVMEFDFMSEDGFETALPAARMAPNFRNKAGGGLGCSGVNIGGPKTADGKVHIWTGNQSYAFSADAYLWHHVTAIYKISCECDANGALSKDTGSQLMVFLDGVYAYTYNNPFSVGSYLFSTMRADNTNGNATGAGNLGKICLDNIRGIAMNRNYVGALDSLFDGAAHNLNDEMIGDLIFNRDYVYPYGRTMCLLSNIDGTVTKFDSFAKALAAHTDGAEIILQRDVTGAHVDKQISIRLSRFSFTDFTYSWFTPETVTKVNPVTGTSESFLKFVKGTKYAYFTWILDPDGTVGPQSRFPVGTVPDFSGPGLLTQYADYENGYCYNFAGWKVFGTQTLGTVTDAQINSYFYVYPQYAAFPLYAVAHFADGTERIFDNAKDTAALLAAIPDGTSVKLYRNITVTAPVCTLGTASLDLNGKTVTVGNKTMRAFPLFSLDTQGASLTVASSVEGAKIVFNMSSAQYGTLFSLANAAQLTFDGANIGHITCGAVAAVDGATLRLSNATFRCEYTTAAPLRVSGAAPVLTLENSVVVFGTAAAVSIGATEDAQVTLAASGLIAGAADAALFAVDADAQVSARIVFTDDTILSALNIPAADGVMVDLTGAVLDSQVTFAEGVVAEGIVVARVAPRYGIDNVVATLRLMPEEKTARIRFADETEEVWAWGEAPSSDSVVAGFWSGNILYSPTGTFIFKDAVSGAALSGTTVSADWCGKVVYAEARYEQVPFDVLLVSSDGSVMLPLNDVSLTDLICAAYLVEGADGMRFVLGKNAILSEFSVPADAMTTHTVYVDLNGYELVSTGMHTLRGNLVVYSARRGAKVTGEGTFIRLVGASTLTVGTVRVAQEDFDGANLAFYVGSLATLRDSAVLTVAGGSYTVTDTLVTVEQSGTQQVRISEANITMDSAATAAFTYAYSGNAWKEACAASVELWDCTLTAQSAATVVALEKGYVNPDIAQQGTTLTLHSVALTGFAAADVHTELKVTGADPADAEMEKRTDIDAESILTVKKLD